MAKKNNKKKTADFLTVTRALTTFTGVQKAKECTKNIKEEDIIGCIEYLKDRVSSEYNHYFSKFLDKYTAIECFNYVQEVILTAYVAPERTKERFNAIRSILVDKIKESELGLKFYFGMSYILADIMSKYQLEGSYIAENINCITTILNNLVIAVMIQVYKFKNNNIKGCVEEDGVISIVYHYSKFVDDDSLNHLYQCLLGKERASNRTEKCTLKIREYFAILFNFSYRINVDEEFIQCEEKRVIYIEDILNDFPLLIDDKSPLTEEELNKIPNGRLYATPSAGIRFEFVDKSKVIEYVDMKENRECIYFKVRFKNNGKFYGSDWFLNRDTIISKENKIESKYVDVAFVFDKEKYHMCLEHGGDGKFISPLSNLFFDGETEDKFREYTAKILFACIYLAYYDPNKFCSEVKLRNRNTSKRDGFEKEESYRVAHLRKLPYGASCSDTAKKNAQKEGFNYIPDGYTFVQASNIHLEGMKRVIKI